VITILILNYVQWGDTSKCVRSLRQSTYTSYEIVIIDNGSPNDSEQQLRKEFPDLTFYQTGKNLGYTGGINFGIRKVLQGKSEFILILNPDTEVDPFCLSRLVRALEENQDAAVAGGTILYASDHQKIWYAGGELIPWKGVAEHFTTMRGEDDLVPGRFRKVTFVTGCAMLLRVSAINSIGFLDERFFMYLDDIEYCARVQRLGFSLIYVPGATIFHNVVWVDEAVHKLYYSIRNRFLLIRTSFFGIDRWFGLFYFSLSLIVKLVNWRFTNYGFFRAAWMGIEDYFLGNFGPGRGLGHVE
jgi:GT2 family glycosyltransferase